MTEEDRLLLDDLKGHTQQLFSQFEILENENKLLEDRVLTLKKDIEILEEQKAELDKKNENLKIATHLLSGVDENREANKKINRLIREIDKCIALLNK